MLKYFGSNIKYMDGLEISVREEKGYSRGDRVFFDFTMEEFERMAREIEPLKQLEPRPRKYIGIENYNLDRREIIVSRRKEIGFCYIVRDFGTNDQGRTLEMSERVFLSEELSGYRP